MYRLLRMLPLWGVLALLSLGMLPDAAKAQARSRCFVETKQCIEGRFLEYWEQNGGLAVFGYPVTHARQERNRDTGKSYLTQWFERNRFELHPENGPPYDVLLGRLGDDRMRMQGIDWQTLRRETQAKPGCRWFPQTGHNVCDQAGGRGFKTYWETHGLADPRLDANGRSLALFGLPLSGPEIETNASGDRVLTQWFERARFEWHPGKPDEFKVLLGLLGAEIELGVGARPAITYVQNNAVYEIGPKGQAERQAPMANLGKVHDAVKWGDAVVSLSERGLQTVFARMPARTTAEFGKGQAIWGSLVTPHNSSQILYAYVREDSSSPTGRGHVIGVIEGATSARKITSGPGSVTVLGLSEDGKAIHVIYRGQDPSFVQVAVVRIEDGKVLAQAPISGEAFAAEAPDRKQIVTVQAPNGSADTLAFYDLTNTSGRPRVVPLPRRGWYIGGLIWSPDSRYVYARVDAGGAAELWRVDARAGKAEAIPAELPEGAPLMGVSHDGRWLLSRVGAGALVVDLTSGRTQMVPFSAEAVLAQWH